MEILYPLFPRRQNTHGLTLHVDDPHMLVFADGFFVFPDLGSLRYVIFYGDIEEGIPSCLEIHPDEDGVWISSPRDRDFLEPMDRGLGLLRKG